MAGKPPKSETVTQLRSKDGDDGLTTLFQEWLIAFEKTQSATGDEETVALLALSRISRASQRHRPRGCGGWW